MFTKLMGPMRKLLINILLFPVLFSFMDVGDESSGGEGGDQGGGQEGEGGGDDQTPEQIEEGRRAALTDEERATEDQAKADEAKKNEGAPDVYEDFKVPEGMEASKDLVDEFKPVLKELNLSQDKAQALIDFYTAKVLPGMQAKGLEVWNNELAQRQQAIEKDPEIGGDKLKATGETINRVANTFLKPEETAELMEYSKRFGDCPAFVKLLTRVGGAMKDDGVVLAGAGGESSAKSLAERLYDGK